ncbi:MAG: SprT-like domain-containing protein [Bacteroidota bacterium]|nr:SprT-like domain-containing protein [Bacteroidota bacterium]
MSSFYSFVPEKSNKLLQCWIDDLKVKVEISIPRKTKLGDFKVRGNQLSITINNNLNKYLFLIVLTHELAHAFVFKKYKNTVKPHAKSWQLTFKSLMLNFLTPDYFPEDILKVLSRHMISPKASIFADLELVKILKRYDNVRLFTLSNLSIGDSFKIASGKIFVKGEKIRKRYKCVESTTNKTYLFHPFAEVIKSE